MGKSQIESYCQISNHSINRFKSFGQISNYIFPSNLKSSSDRSQICNFRFKLDTFVYLFSTTSKTVWYMYSGSVITVIYCNTVVSRSDLKCMRSSSAATVRAVSRALLARVMHSDIHPSSRRCRPTLHRQSKPQYLPASRQQTSAPITPCWNSELSKCKPVPQISNYSGMRDRMVPSAYRRIYTIPSNYRHE